MRRVRGDRRDGVDPHAVALELAGHDDRHRRDAGLGRGVVHLPGVAVQTGLGRGVHDHAVDRIAGVLGQLPPVHAGEVRGAEMALEVDVDHDVPLVLGHREAHPVAEDAGVVHQHVHAAERVDGLRDQMLGAGPRGDVVEVGHRLATGLGDLVDHLRRRRFVGTLTRGRPAQVVHHDLGALGRQQQRLGATDAAARARDDRDLAVEQPHASPLV